MPGKPLTPAERQRDEATPGRQDAASSSTQRRDRQRRRVADGLIYVAGWVDEQRLIGTLVHTGFLDPNLADNRQAIIEAFRQWIDSQQNVVIDEL